MNEREFSKKIKSAFSAAVPSDELTDRLMKAAPRKTHRFSALKIIAASAAACAMIGVGVYAASEISYDDVFGNYVRVDDNELADSLMGTVTDFKYKVSDEDYAIRILGAAGDSHNMMLRAEIYRVDGEPVRDHFINLPDENCKGISTLFDKHKTEFTNGGHGSYSKEFTEEGNVLLTYRFSYDSNINGKKFNASGSDLYSDKPMWDFLSEYQIGTRGKNEKYCIDIETGEEMEFADDDIIGIRLDWSFSLRFAPSDKADTKKVCTDTSQDFIFDYSQSIISWNEEGEGHQVDSLKKTLQCSPSAIEFTSVGGRIEYEYSDTFDYNGYVQENYPDKKVTLDSGGIIPGFSSNEMYLIRNDGSHIRVRSGGGSSSVSGDICSVIVDLEYEEPTGESNELGEIYEQIYTDISDVKAFYINGVTYDLK